MKVTRSQTASPGENRSVLHSQEWDSRWTRVLRPVAEMEKSVGALSSGEDRDGD
jgi:hypothetical protein